MRRTAGGLFIYERATNVLESSRLERVISHRPPQNLARRRDSSPSPAISLLLVPSGAVSQPKSASPWPDRVKPGISRLPVQRFQRTGPGREGSRTFDGAVTCFRRPFRHCTDGGRRFSKRPGNRWSWWWWRSPCRVGLLRRGDFWSSVGAG